MRKILFCAAALLGCSFFSGCTINHTPYLYNPVHRQRHVARTFGPEGELHRLHIDIDRVFLGIANYEELETTEYIYSE